MITKAKSKRTNGKKPKSTIEEMERAAASKKERDAKLATLPKSLATVETKVPHSNAGIHQVAQDAVTRYCHRILDRAVCAIINDAGEIALCLAENVTEEYAAWFQVNYDEGEKRLIEFELLKAKAIDPTLDEYADVESARCLWWPIVKKLRADVWEEAFNESWLRDTLNLALACEVLDHKRDFQPQVD